MSLLWIAHLLVPHLLVLCVLRCTPQTNRPGFSATVYQMHLHHSAAAPELLYDTLDGMQQYATVDQRSGGLHAPSHQDTPQALLLKDAVLCSLLDMQTFVI